MPETIEDQPCPTTTVTLDASERLAHAVACPGCGWIIWPDFWSPGHDVALPAHTITINGRAAGA